MQSAGKARQCPLELAIMSSPIISAGSRFLQSCFSPCASAKSNTQRQPRSACISRVVRFIHTQHTHHRHRRTIHTTGGLCANVSLNFSNRPMQNFPLVDPPHNLLPAIQSWKTTEPAMASSSHSPWIQTWLPLTWAARSERKMSVRRCGTPPVCAWIPPVWWQNVHMCLSGQREDKRGEVQRMCPGSLSGGCLKKCPTAARASLGLQQ